MTIFCALIHNAVGALVTEYCSNIEADRLTAAPMTHTVTQLHTHTVLLHGHTYLVKMRTSSCISYSRIHEQINSLCIPVCISYGYLQFNT